MFRMLLLAISIILMGTVYKFCNLCDYFDGYQCLGGMKECWKFDILWYNKSCTTENFYLHDRRAGSYIFRYAKMSCKPCARGMYQLYHDLLKETFCCTQEDFCNSGDSLLETSSLYLQDLKISKELND